MDNNDALRQALLKYATENPGAYIVPGWDGDSVRRALAASKPEPVGINGLTEAETAATASVMGLTRIHKADPDKERADLIRKLRRDCLWIPGKHYVTQLEEIMDEAAAVLTADKAGGSVVRYCYECGTIGEVGEGKRDCCPDGSHAKYVHPVIAEQAQAGFYPSLKCRHQPQSINDATLKEKP